MTDALSNGETSSLTSDTDFIAQERACMREKLEKLKGQVKRVERVLKALDAYQSAKGAIEPSASTSTTTAAPPRQTPRKRPPASDRAAVLALIRENTAGLTRGEIVKRLSLVNDPSGEKFVSNSLYYFRKTGKIDRRENGVYRPI